MGPKKEERTHDYYLRMIAEERQKQDVIKAKGHLHETDVSANIQSAIIEPMVHHPPHYNQAGIECIDAIEAALGPEGFRSYCQGNTLKYIWRYKYKGGVEDLKKGKWYLDKLIGSVE